jgi:hypothetical protein
MNQLSDKRQRLLGYNAEEMWTSRCLGVINALRQRSPR